MVDPEIRPPAEEPAEQAGVPGNQGVIDAAADLAKTTVEYVRQEIGAAVHDKAVVPLQKAGGTIGLAIGAGLVIFLGVGYIATGLLILLATWITWPGALILIGSVLMVVAGVLLAMRARSMQA